MKLDEHKRAIDLRRQGMTYAEIQARLAVSKGSLSRWLRAIPHVPHSDSMNRRHLSRIQNGQVLHRRKLIRVEAIRSQAAEEISQIDEAMLKIIGVIAYWCEGSKTIDSLVKFTNSDERLIRLFIQWLVHSCEVPRQRIRIHIRVHEDISSQSAEQYWSRSTGIPPAQFYRTTIKQSGSHGKRRRRLPHGVVSVIVCDSRLFYRIKGWIDGLTVR